MRHIARRDAPCRAGWLGSIKWVNVSGLCSRACAVDQDSRSVRGKKRHRSPGPFTSDLALHPLDSLMEGANYPALVFSGGCVSSHCWRCAWQARRPCLQTPGCSQDLARATFNSQIAHKGGHQADHHQPRRNCMLTVLSSIPLGLMTTV